MTIHRLRGSVIHYGYINLTWVINVRNARHMQTSKFRKSTRLKSKHVIKISTTIVKFREAVTTRNFALHLLLSP